MNIKDIEKAIIEFTNKGLSDDAHMIVKGEVLNELAGQDLYDENSLYEIKDGSIRKIV